MNAGAPLDRPPYRFITKTDEASCALDAIRGETVIGLDTETYWEADAGPRISLVQIAPRASEVLVFDVVAVGIEGWRPIIESPAVTMAAHNARFDQGVLIDAGLQPAAFIDTLRLARARLCAYLLTHLRKFPRISSALSWIKVFKSLTGDVARSRARK